MSVRISIRQAKKAFGTNVVIPDLDLDIHEGELFTLLGPSGCGKTTLLRMIAGFNTVDGGSFYFNENLINDLDASKREIGMVFQNYAIFPHLSVRRNVEYGLRNRKLSGKEIHERAEHFLRMMQIDEYADTMPDKLSGGQQQRVALARALCIEPKVLLMDEPLSNLDAKLRVEMRAAIKQIQHSVGITTVYVTHDQEEAMAISDRIAVMDRGVIQQIGKPRDLYQRPVNLFVSTFIGRSNILEGILETRGEDVFIVLEGLTLKIDTLKPGMEIPGKALLSIRPEEFVFTNDQSGMKATVKDCVFLGLNTHYFLRLADGREVESIQESGIGSDFVPGDTVHLSVNTKKVNAFNIQTELSLMNNVRNDIRQKAAGET